MYISVASVEFILSQCRVEYSGTHNSDSKNPLWGRAAYWRIYLGDTYICKITAPVKSINPRPATLHKLLVNELRERIFSIGEYVEMDHYAQIKIERRDPSGVERLVNNIVGKYWDIETRKKFLESKGAVK